MLCKLRSPAVRDRVLAEGAGLARKGGSEDGSIDLHLVGMRGILSDIVAQGCCIIWRTARQDAKIIEEQLACEGCNAIKLIHIPHI